jgi:peptidoglycan/xylan/chitin deacetylase (PgdA/CDA1 family)
MYHSVSDDPEPTFPPYYKVCTSPRRFAEQMQWLAEGGWRGVTLSEGIEILASRSQTGARPVAITFDDGFRDFYSEAYPILRRHGFSATMYLPTAFIGEQRLQFKDRECLTWAEVTELHHAGIEFGSHTVNHPVLAKLSWSEIEKELRESKSTIETRLSGAVRTFAYPFAFPQTDHEFSIRFLQTLRAVGYESCVTTEIGTVIAGDELLQLKRLPANVCDDSALLHAKLAGAYDWLRLPQNTIKRVKSLRSSFRAASPKS